MPYSINWFNYQQSAHFAGYVLGVAEKMGIKLRWGEDWDRDGQLKDQRFMRAMIFIGLMVIIRQWVFTAALTVFANLPFQLTAPLFKVSDLLRSCAIPAKSASLVCIADVS